ncbi:MAG: aldo/keto reductase [Deltaproteobacteria bacterium]|nr:aldo/keto reductase [Deltaproteobacteria bacterium]
MAYANRQATLAWAALHPTLEYKELGSTGLLVSQAGFGTYRVQEGSPEHHQALLAALRDGVNLIDTSTNYALGDSERLVGRVLAEAAATGGPAREQVVVVSKAGYLQGPLYEASQEKKAAGQPWPDLVEYGPGLEHCLHPDFLAQQLTASLERLKLNRLDVYLLHNPEYFLGWAAQQGLAREEVRVEYLRRLGLAFEHLESEVAAGRLSWYGVSSNTLIDDADSPNYTSLGDLWRLAEVLGPDHHFRVIEFPCNLYETAAATLANQEGGRTLLELARELHLGVLINRPLNAIWGAGLLRLADFPAMEPPAPREITESLAELIASEAVGRQLAERLARDPEMAEQMAPLWGLGELLTQNWDRLHGLEHWRQVAQGHVLPRVNFLFQTMLSLAGGGGETADWVSLHRARVERVLRALEALYLAMAAKESLEMKARARAVDPDWATAATLSQLAVRALRTTSGVTTVLVGMRRPPYVRDVLEELLRPGPVRPRAESWQALAQENQRQNPPGTGPPHA